MRDRILAAGWVPFLDGWKKGSLFMYVHNDKPSLWTWTQRGTLTKLKDTGWAAVL